MLEWAKEEAARKKKADFSAAEFLTMKEGLCVQCMHVGSYDCEPATIEAMHRFAEEQGCAIDLTDLRLHHEIYLSDPRRTAPERLKTVIRLPVKRIYDAARVFAPKSAPSGRSGAVRSLVDGGMRRCYSY